MDEEIKHQQAYIIVDSFKYGQFPIDYTEKCACDLIKEHRSLRANKNYLRSLTGSGSYCDSDFNIRYLYVASNMFTAGSGKYLEFTVQYAGSTGFKSVLFDIIDNQTFAIVYRIFEVPKNIQNKRFKINIPLDPDINTKDMDLRIKQLYKTKNGDDIIFQEANIRLGAMEREF